jgi:hypothetical protein
MNQARTVWKACVACVLLLHAASGAGEEAKQESTRCRVVDGSFSFEVPRGWRVDLEGPARVIIVPTAEKQSAQRAYCGFFATAVAKGKFRNLKEYLDKIVEGYARQGGLPQTVLDRKEFALDGREGERIVFSRDGDGMVEISYSVKIGDQILSGGCWVREAEWKDHLESSDALMRTVRFEAAGPAREAGSTKEGP